MFFTVSYFINFASTQKINNMRKTFLIFTIILLVTSCSNKYPRMIYNSSIDYSSYTKNGFFITESNSVSFDYEAIGSVTTQITDGWEVVKGKKPEGKSYDYYELKKIKYGEYLPLQYEDAIDQIVSQAKRMGANGLINLTFTYTGSISGKYGGLISPEKITVSGMAIKRKP